MKPLLLTHPDCMHHEMPGHPERPARLTAVMEKLRASGMASDMIEILASGSAQISLPSCILTAISLI
jgi:acetoin utilization deacetylase AcuC-like enzyme